MGEQHVQEDLGRIPSFAEWALAIQPQRWMGQALKLSKALEAEGSATGEQATKKAGTGSAIVASKDLDLGGPF